jgi:hypothetical protein
VEALVKALTTAKAALGEQNFKAADLQLAKAEAVAKLPAHKQAVARLTKLADYLTHFREVLVSAAKGMEAGSSFKVGTSTQVSMVEATADKVIVRIAGMNKSYPYSELPPGLALTLADQRLAANDPAGNVMKGAYLLVHKRATSKETDKARELWQQAVAAGTDISDLLPLLDENYSELLKDVTPEAKTDSK